MLKEESNQNCVANSTMLTIALDGSFGRASKLYRKLYGVQYTRHNGYN